MKIEERPDVYNLGTHYLDSSAGSPPAILNEIWMALQLAKPNEGQMVHVSKNRPTHRSVPLDGTE